MIPVVLFFFARKRQEIPFRNMFWLFGLFIFFCGTTHLVDVVTFRYPVYRFLGLMKLLTAIVSWATVFALIPLVPRFLSMKSPEALEMEVAERKRAEEALKLLNDELEEKVAQRTELAMKRADELVEAQRILTEKTKILESILENLGEGVVVIDRSERYIHVNAAARKLLPVLEAPPDQAGDWPEQVRFLDETGRVLEAQEMPLLVATRQVRPVDAAELQVVGQETAGWLRVTARPLPPEIGGAVAVIHDITQRKQTLQELTDARDTALRANRVKSEFLAVMSHELRTPLNGVRGMLEALGDTRLEDKQKEFVDTALGCSETLMRLIDDLLDLTKIESGKLDIHVKPFDPGRLMAKVEGVFAPRLESGEVTLRSSLDPVVPEWVLGDEPRLLQIASNLVGNAIKYSQKGEVSFELSYQDSQLQLVVKDQGPGIPKEFHAELFDPFTQMDSSRARRQGGVGLGLAIVDRLVKVLGGVMTFESVVDQGTRFQISVPAEACQAPEADPDAPNSIDLAELKVLVVEDNPINRRIVGMQLRKLSVGQVLVAEDGQQALQLAAGQNLDIILLDCQMPGLDGLEVARLLRADPQAYGNPVIIALTAHALREERERCFEAGMDDFLSKPLAFAELRRALTEWWKKLTDG